MRQSKTHWLLLDHEDHQPPKSGFKKSATEKFVKEENSDPEYFWDHQFQIFIQKIRTFRPDASDDVLITFNSKQRNSYEENVTEILQSCTKTSS